MSFDNPPVPIFEPDTLRHKLWFSGLFGPVDELVASLTAKPLPADRLVATVAAYCLEHRLPLNAIGHLSYAAAPIGWKPRLIPHVVRLKRAHRALPLGTP